MGHFILMYYITIFFLAFEGYEKPVNWRKNVWELDTTDPNNNGFENEDFIVWMRTAALPSFRKLYRIIDSPLSNGLPAGNYTLLVDYSKLLNLFSFNACTYYKNCCE